MEGESFDRENIVFDRIENRIKQITSDPIIIVHMIADKSIIEERMEKLRSRPEHSNSPLQKQDIEDVMKNEEIIDFHNIRRRVRVGFGPCQGTFCNSRLANLLVGKNSNS